MKFVLIFVFCLLFFFFFTLLSKYRYSGADTVCDEVAVGMVYTYGFMTGITIIFFTAFFRDSINMHGIKAAALMS